MSGLLTAPGEVDNDYDFLEPVLATRCSLLSALQHREKLRTVAGETMEQPLLSWAKTARKAQRFQV